MEDIFKQAKFEQKQADEAFKEELIRASGMVRKENINVADLLQAQEVIPERVAKTRKGSRKSAAQTKGSDKKLIPGSVVLVTSGSFAGFKGSLKEVDGKAGKV